MLVLQHHYCIYANVTPVNVMQVAYLISHPISLRTLNKVAV